MRAAIAMIQSLALVVMPACGKSKDTSTSSGSAGSGTSQGPTGGPTPPTGPVGGGAKVGTAEATIELPPGVDPANVTITPKPTDTLPPSIQPYKKAIEQHFTIVKLVELGPNGTTLPAAAAVTVTIDPKTIPAGKSLADLLAVSVAADGTIEELPVTPVGTDQVRVPVRHFSFLMIAGFTLGSVLLLGGIAYTMKQFSEPLKRKDCSSWLTPDSPKISELAADPQGFTIAPAGDAGAKRAVTLKASLKGKDVDQGAHALKPDQVLAAGVGDCVNMSNVTGSLLLARKYPVRLVAGTASYPKAAGFHQWAETVVDGKPYYVDTFEPSNIKLIPLHQASVDLKLERNMMCGRNPDGTTVGPGAYDARWITPFEGEPGPDWVKLETELSDLKDQHKALNAECIRNAANTAACHERRVVYERAMKLQEEITALKKREAGTP